MTRTLITGMSATGKSTVIAHLSARGLRAVDLDTDAWSHDVPDDSEFADPEVEGPLDRRWREDKVRALLMDHQGSSRAAGGQGPLFIAGTSTFQGRLYPLLSHVVLLTVPDDVAMARLADRTTNDYGKDPAELARELRLRSTVEPLLRAGACRCVRLSLGYSVGLAGRKRENRAQADGGRSSAGAPGGTSGTSGATGGTGA